MEGTLANVTLFAGNFAPRMWAICDGTLLNISTNTALFALIGTTYGGNGQTTFALPDLRGRVPVGTGNGAGLSSYIAGQASGTETNTMLYSNLPPHIHAAVVSIRMPVNNSTANMDAPENAVYAPAGTVNMYNPTAGTNQNFGALNVTANLQVTGGGSPIPNMMPYTAMNYVICTQGIFPSRS